MPSLLSQQPTINIRGANDIALLHKLECRACPLNKQAGTNMPASGAEKPLIYVLGEAPGKDEQEQGVQFVGESGQLLRANIPRDFKRHLRFNNIVRTRPPGNATPEKVEIECCRPSIVRDIEQTKPKIVLGFGNVPLNWVSGFNGITFWRGRRMPVKIGSHSCWYYPMLHPSFLLRQRRGNGMPSEDERMFRLDLQRAFAEVENLPPAIVHTPAMVQEGTEIITEGGSVGLRQLREALEWAAEQPAIGLDYETKGLRPYDREKTKVLSASVSDGTRSIAFPFDHSESQWTPQDRNVVQELWIKFLTQAKGVKIAHNLSFEMEWSGVRFDTDTIRAGRWEDSSTQACIIDERKGDRKPGCFSLEFLVQQYFGFNIKKLAGVDRGNLDETPIEAVLMYNAPDAKYAKLLWDKQRERIEADGLQEAYELGLRRVPACVLTQIKGLPVDQKEVARLQVKYGNEIERVEKQISKISAVKEFERQKGRRFEPFSNPDVIFLLKDILKRTEIFVEDKYTKKQKLSADKKVLDLIDHPFAKLLVELREQNKRKSTYVDPLSVGSPILYPDQLIHAQYNTIFAETGRFSVNDPSLQNFPKRNAEAVEVRKQVAAPPGCVVLSIDLGQIEARIIAIFTKDKHFVKALWERYDIHMEWTERLAHAYPARIGGKKFLTDKKVMKTFRTDVKNQWTFPLFFGARLESASGYLKIPPEVLKPIYNEFWRQFAGVKAWQDKQVEFYNEHGYVSCLTGRRRRGPLSLNQILNSPVQGTAAELIAVAMARLSEMGDPELQPELNIHDDLTWVRVPEKRVDYVAENAIKCMIDAPFPWAKLVPLTAEMSVGPNWFEMESVGEFSSDEWGFH